MATYRMVYGDKDPVTGHTAAAIPPPPEVLRGEDVVAHKPAPTNWTVTSRETRVA
jgi:hypothetical protein